MTRRAMISADVATTASGLAVTGPPIESLAGGTKTVTSAATPEKLLASSRPCRAVWFGAPMDANGDATNTKPVFIGDADSQNIPIVTSNFEGIVISIDDAGKLYVKVGADGEGVVYRVLA